MVDNTVAMKLCFLQHQITREELEKALSEKTGWGRNEILTRFDSLGFLISMRMGQEVLKMSQENVEGG